MIVYLTGSTVHCIESPRVYGQGPGYYQTLFQQWLKTLHTLFHLNLISGEDNTEEL